LEDQFFGKEEINRDLDLSSVEFIHKGFNPNVGEKIYLGS